MKKLQVYVCENLYPEYEAVLDAEKLSDVKLSAFPSMCDVRTNKEEARKKFNEAEQENSLLFCSRSCEAIKLTPEKTKIEKVTTNYCFGHLISDDFLDYLTSQGNYIVSTGWLRKWKRHINDMGFDKKTARMFFQETSKQIVFLDAKIEEEAERYLEELSSYIGIPYLIVSVELEAIRLLLNSKVYEWRLRKQKEESTATISSLRSQSAEYAAVFDMLGKISTFTSKREVIGKIKELFLMVFGAEDFRFWEADSDIESSELKKFKSSEGDYVLFRDENRFCINVAWNDFFYGILDVSGFITPKYIDKYLNLALEVAKLSGLVLHNNEQYQKVVESEKELKYLSYHDSMTGLYNRTYINEIMNDKVNDVIVVFMFDIDKLKYVNDNYGHSEGDRLIKRFASVLKDSFREKDVVARIGGDEFVAIMHDVSEEAAKTVRERVLDSIEIDNYNSDNKNLELSASIGYALKENEDDTIEDLMKKADKRMYVDKSKKKKN